MGRTYSQPDSESPPEIDREAVAAFFDERARRIGELGPTRAVIYQDKHPDLAERRDRAEKQRLRPLLELDGSQRLLDVGCGTGRWVPELADACAWYHGVDLTPGLVDYAQRVYGSISHCRFSVASVTEISLPALAEVEPFDRILCAGLMIYLNDNELSQALTRLADVAADESLIVLREPVGLDRRLTLTQHFSTDLEQEYSAIYRTESELLGAIERVLSPRGFSVILLDDVFRETDLNNRSDTKQRVIVLRRS